jgi:hypothetical protein
MFKKLFKTKVPDFAATNVMAAPQKKAQMSDSPYSGDVPLPEVRELDSESAWAAFSEDQETVQSVAFSETLPMEALAAESPSRSPFSSGYQDILNELEQDQSQRKRTPQTP